MLHQVLRRAVPDRDVFYERTLFRDPRFCVAVVVTHGLAVDRGALGSAVRFPSRLRRPQLTLVLQGRGYLQVGGVVCSLCAGDVVESHQATHEAEGYGGAPGTALLIDWDEGSPFASPPAAASVRRARLTRHDVDGLLALVNARATLPAPAWMQQLVDRLRALGMPAGDGDVVGAAGEAAPVLARVYAGIGAALSALGEHPSLADLAASVGVSERQVLRRLDELRRWGHAFEGWRDLLHETRLDWAVQLLSVPGLSLEQVARVAGYRSTVALHHALSTRGADTPAELAQRLVDRWQ